MEAASGTGPFEKLSAFAFETLIASLKFVRPILLYMSGSFCSTRKFESLVISTIPERPGHALVRTLMEKCQGAGVPFLTLPVFVRFSRAFIEMLCDGSFMFGRDTTTGKSLTGDHGEAQML
jgi:hypothetical protein